MTDHNDETSEITSDDKLWAALAYVFTPLIPIIILLLEDQKDRPFIKAHNAQALTLGVAAFVINFALSFVLIGFCTGLLTIVLVIYYAVKAYNGEYIEIPIITDFVKNQGWA